MKENWKMGQKMMKEGILKEEALYTQSEDQLSEQGSKINSDEAGSLLNG